MPVCLASDSQVNMNRPLPELLAPAGSIDALLAAVAAGADAVYCGLGAFNARASAKDIEPVEFVRAVRLAHAHGVRVYVTCNVYLREHELVPALDLVREADAAGADAFIVADVAQVRAIRRAIPHAEIHLSTQTGVMSPTGVEYVREHLGVERITVSRELSLPEIASVCSVDMPIEVFCHGAICICYSGACAASALRRGRSANRGDCTQPCRFTYDLQDGEGSSVNVQEGERLLCPRDYCSIDHVRELVEAGVSALKIEGRMKNPDYVFNVVGAYRRALDAVGAGSWDSDVAAACKRKLGMSFNRGFTDAYLRGASGAELMSFERACTPSWSPILPIIYRRMSLGALLSLWACRLSLLFLPLGVPVFPWRSTPPCERRPCFATFELTRWSCARWRLTKTRMHGKTSCRVLPSCSTSLRA